MFKIIELMHMQEGLHRLARVRKTVVNFGLFIDKINV